MKFRNLYITCRENINVIKGITFRDTTYNSRPAVNVFGWGEACAVLRKFIEFEPLRKKSENLINAVPEIFRSKDSFMIEPAEKNQISAARTNLVDEMALIIRLSADLGIADEERNGLDIKLPPYKDFSEFRGYIDDIEFILTKCPFLQAEGEELRFDNVDVGSTWLTFFVVGAALTGGSLLFNNIAAFVDKCLVIRSHYLTVQRQKAELDSMEMTAEEKAIIGKYLRESYEKQLNWAIAELEEATHYTVENKDGDEKNRIIRCMEKMGELTELGFRIQSSLDAPGETKALFDALEMRYLLPDTSSKLIEEKNDQE